MTETSSTENTQQQQQALASLMNYLDKECPEMALFGIFVDRFESDESSNNVRIWFKNGNYYEGAFSGGTMDGVGKYQWSEGLSYHGTFQKNSLDGFGTYNWPDGSSYEGDVKEGVCHGNGMMRLPNGQLYSGQWADGRKEGTGTMTYDPNGHDFYSGEWAKERRHGFGSYQYGPDASDAVYAGYWSNGCRHGAGSAVWPHDRQVYSGYWDRGVQQGVGRHVWASDRITPAQYQLQNSYIGDWSAGLRHGDGVFYYAGGASYRGNWVDNIKHGSGKVTFKNGQSYDGVFEQDRLVGGPGNIDIARTPDPRLFERKLDNDETLSAFLVNFVPQLLGNSLFDVVRSDGTIIGPTNNNAESGMAAVNNCCTVLLRFASELRRIFAFYSELGYRRENENPSQLQSFNSRSLMQILWWRMVKDTHIPFSKIRIQSIVDLDRRLAAIFKFKTPVREDIHDVLHPILFGDFLLWLLATALFSEGYGHPGYLNQDAPIPPASVCLERFLTEFILPNSCIVHGRLFSSVDNSATTIRNLHNLMQFYKTIADNKVADNDKTVTGRQLVAVLVASGVSAATPAVKALAGNVFLSSELEATSHVFAELSPLEVGEALAEIAEFINQGLVSSGNLMTDGDTAVVSVSAPPVGEGSRGSAIPAPEKPPTILGSILQESNVVDGGIFAIRNREDGAIALPIGKIDWTNIIQHLLSLPDLEALPRLALSIRQTTLTVAGRALSGISSSERSISPQGRVVTDAESGN